MPTATTTTVPISTGTQPASASTLPRLVVTYPHIVKPFNGTTSQSSFKEHFERCCKANEWTTNANKVQNLSLALEGSAADILTDIDDTAPSALDDIWKALSKRFGDIDEQREHQRRFDNRKQYENESIQEYEQALKTLFHKGWPKATTKQRDAALKCRFEDGVLSPDLTQYLRPHACDADFDETMQHARRFIT